MFVHEDKIVQSGRRAGQSKAPSAGAAPKERLAPWDIDDPKDQARRKGKPSIQIPSTRTDEEVTSPAQRIFGDMNARRTKSEGAPRRRNLKLQHEDWRRRACAGLPGSKNIGMQSGSKMREMKLVKGEPKRQGSGQPPTSPLQQFMEQQRRHG